MKKRNLFVTLGLTLALGLGVGVGLSARQQVRQAKAEAVGAGGAQLYVDATNWSTADAETQVYCFGTELEGTWLTGTKLDDDNKMYSFTLPEKTEKFDVVRMDPSKDPSKWESKWNQTADIVYDSSRNGIIITSLNGDDCGKKYEDFAFYAKGTKFYFTAISESYSWLSDSAKTKITFWDSVGVEGSILSSSNTVEFELARSVITTGFNVYRLNPLDDSNWNQTVNFEVSSSNQSDTAIAVRAFVESEQNKWAPKYGDGLFEFAKEYLALAFGIHFLNETKEACADENADNNAALAAKWADIKAVYGALLDNAEKKNAFKDGADAKVAEARQRYSHIIGKYTSLERFVQGVEPSIKVSVNLPTQTINNNVTIIICVASALALVLVLGLFLIKRHKED